MLNIDFTNRKTFLISFGINLVFLGCLLFFGNGIYMTERLDSFTHVIISNNSEAMNLYELTYPSIFKTTNMILYFSLALVIMGVLITIVGLSINAESSNMPSSRTSRRTSPRRRFSWRNEIKELWHMWNGLIAELFLIVASVIASSYLVMKEIPFAWAILLILAALAIKKSMN